MGALYEGGEQYRKMRHSGMEMADKVNEKIRRKDREALADIQPFGRHL